MNFSRIFALVFLTAYAPTLAQSAPATSAKTPVAKSTVSKDNGPAVLAKLQSTTWWHHQRKSDLTAADKTRSEAAKKEIVRLDAMIKSNPRDAKSLVQRALAHLDVVVVGFVYNEYGEPKKAMADLDFAIAADPKNMEARALRYRMTLLEIQQYNPAMAAMQGSAPIDFSERALVARTDLNVVLEKHPKWAQGHFDGALLRRTSYQQRLRRVLDVKQSDSLEKRAASVTDSMLLDDELQLALSDAAEAVSLDPSLRPLAVKELIPSAGSRAAHLHQSRQDPDTQIEIAKLAMQIEGESERWLDFRRKAYLSYGDKKRGISTVSEEIATAQRSKASAESQMQLLLLRSHLLLRDKQSSAGQQDLAAAIKLAPRSIEPYLSGAKSIYEDKNMAGVALQFLNQGAALAGSDVRFYLLRAELHRAMGKLAQSVADFQKAVTQQPNNIEFLMQLAQAQQLNNQLSEAVATARKASTLTGFKMTHRLLLTYLLALSNDEASMRREYKGVALNREALQPYLTAVKSSIATKSNPALLAMQQLLEADIARQ